MCSVENSHLHKNKALETHSVELREQQIGEHTHTHKQTKAVMNRLSKISGHVEAIKNMVEDGRDCSEVLIQLSAIRSAINGVSKVILKDHMEHCMVHAALENDKKAMDDLNKAIDLFMK